MARGMLQQVRGYREGEPGEGGDVSAVHRDRGRMVRLVLYAAVTFSPPSVGLKNRLLTSRGEARSRACHARPSSWQNRLDSILHVPSVADPDTFEPWACPSSYGATRPPITPARWT